MNRSGSLNCSLCKEKNILICHHIKGRDIPNANHPSNLVNLCDNCHRKVHEGKIILEGWFKSTKGIELIWHYKNEESFSGRNEKTYLIGG